ncbi:MAG: redox-sensing transcriptional repressor Rex [Planctomycetes bacterium]|nr:redox-sensing transcriptional repressor Rex [Planctomycetota bacterium]MBU1518877.1 redox-sensing transcriptional repressor Rex [Planctomycetota bacterium]MBU2457164.1 redox-sensing transcriptional repressor Rex [Planctomycetota bacterium]MBU2596476.1 redox-sensing transcriptional repressor Rex [Planctomycetota bacterium]
MANRTRILRLSRYKNAVLRLKSLNFLKVFSDNLADATGVTASQVRKDFSIFGISGNRRGGYQIDELLTQLNKVLGKDNLQKFIVVGVGNMGRALINYPGFAKSEIKIVAGFDIDSAKYNRKADAPIFPMDELAGFVKTNEIELGIIVVPDFAAQEVFEKLVRAGIKGVLNFAPIRLRSDNTDVIVHNLNLETEIENLIYFVNTKTSPTE